MLVKYAIFKRKNLISKGACTKDLCKSAAEPVFQLDIFLFYDKILLLNPPRFYFIVESAG